MGVSNLLSFQPFGRLFAVTIIGLGRGANIPGTPGNLAKKKTGCNQTCDQEELRFELRQKTA
jgi:hypothetical protein